MATTWFSMGTRPTVEMLRHEKVGQRFLQDFGIEEDTLLETHVWNRADDHYYPKEDPAVSELLELDLTPELGDADAGTCELPPEPVVFGVDPATRDPSHSVVTLWANGGGAGGSATFSVGAGGAGGTCTVSASGAGGRGGAGGSGAGGHQSGVVLIEWGDSRPTIPDHILDL